MGEKQLDVVRYKYIEFIMTGSKPKTAIWRCQSRRSGDVLGYVHWYGPWRQYCFFPAEESVFNDGCLLDIVDFLDKARKARE